MGLVGGDMIFMPYLATVSDCLSSGLTALPPTLALPLSALLTAPALSGAH